jgi:hypothetical protein
VNDIFKAHQEWLDKGGDQAVKAVREANLVAMIDAGLRAVEAASYQRGSGDGYRLGRQMGWAAACDANRQGGGRIIYPSEESYEQRATSPTQEEKDILEQKDQAFRVEADAEMKGRKP